MTGVFPIWKRDTHQLARQIIAMGFKSILTLCGRESRPWFCRARV